MRVCAHVCVDVDVCQHVRLLVLGNGMENMGSYEGPLGGYVLSLSLSILFEPSVTFFSLCQYNLARYCQ